MQKQYRCLSNLFPMSFSPSLSICFILRKKMPVVIIVIIILIIFFDIASIKANNQYLKLPKYDLAFSLNNKPYTISMYLNDDPNILVSAFCYDNSVNKNDCDSIRKVLKEKKIQLSSASSQIMNNKTNNYDDSNSDISQLRNMPITLDETKLVQLDLFGENRDNFYYLIQDFCEEYGIALMECDTLFDMAFQKRMEAEGQNIYQKTVSSIIGGNDNKDKDVDNLNRYDVKDKIKQFENSLQNMFHLFMSNYETLSNAYKSKIEPTARLLVENREMYSETFRYLFLLRKHENDEEERKIILFNNNESSPPLPHKHNQLLHNRTNSLTLSSFSSAFNKILSDTQYGMADRHGRNRIGEGLRLPIDRFDANNFTYAEYLRYAKTSTPVIITGMISQVTYDGIVPGLPNWTLERLNKLCFNRIFDLKKMVVNDTNSWARMKLEKKILAKKYLDMMEFGEITSTSVLEDLYLHDASLKKACPELLKDVIVPKYFSEDLMQRLPASLHWQYKNYRDYWPSLFISGKNTSSALHADWANSAAWMGLMSGKKRWRIVHPRDRPLLYEDPMKKNVFPSDLFNHDDKNFPTVKYASVYEAVLEPGEVIFIPSAAPHQVLNIGETISIAMNFIDIAAFDSFKKDITKNKFAGSFSHYVWLDKVLDAFDKLDLSNEYAMLTAAMQGDDLLVETMNVPTHKRVIDYKLKVH